jgi:tRNA1(Val) A37 N6-methylase TrmN6
MSFVPTQRDDHAHLTDDAVLGGRLRLRQPRRGHRVGHDAILLAAAAKARAGEHAVDLGAGVGAAGLALALRVAGLKVTLVEIEPELSNLAAENSRRNGLSERVQAVTLDVSAAARAYVAAGLPPGSVDHVLMNPPFNDPRQQQVSPDARKRAAHAAVTDPAATLALWVRTAARLLRPAGSLTLIWRADGLADVLSALAHGFGEIAVLPVHPAPSKPAIRILVRAVKGSRAPFALLQGLVLNDEAGSPADAAEAVLRHGAALSLAQDQ